MISRSFVKRTALLASITALCAGNATQQAQAGPLCDWLFGRNTTPYTPYAAGYPVTLPVGTVPMAAPQAAYYPPAYAPQTSYYAPVYVPQVSYNPPAYGLGGSDAGYAIATPAPGTTFPVADQQTSFYGTGNVYPTDQYGQVAPAQYSAPAQYGGVAPVTAYRPATVNYPSTVQTYPGVPASSPGVMGGMSRFFGSMFGTNYQSSYNPAAVTYYRPVVTVDPTTGAQTVVQQPCSSYEYQMQRSPYVSLAPSYAPVTAPASGACATGAGYAASGVGAYNPYAGSPITTSPAPSSYVAPATSYADPNSGSVPANFYYAPPVTGGLAPATGSPLPGPTPSSPDTTTVPQPQLDVTGQPAATSSYNPNAGNTPGVASYSSARPLPATTNPYSSDYVRTTTPGVANSGVVTAPALQPLPASTPSTSTQGYQSPGARALPSNPPASIPQGNNSWQDRPSTSPSAPQPLLNQQQDQDRVAQATWVAKPIQWVSTGAANAPALEPPALQATAKPEPVEQYRAENRPQRALQRTHSGYDNTGWTSKPPR